MLPMKLLGAEEKKKQQHFGSNGEKSVKCNNQYIDGLFDHMTKLSLESIPCRQENEDQYGYKATAISVVG